MKRAWLSTTIAALIGCTAALGAQGATTSQSKAAKTTATAQQEQTVMVTGCLQLNETGATASTTPSSTTTKPRTSAAAPALPSFTLANATMSGGGAGAGAGAPSSTFMLQGSDLSDHVGQQVEVRGMIMPPAKSSSAHRSSHGGTAATSGASHDAAATATGTTGSATADATATPHIRVSSVRMLSPSCSGAGASPNR